MTQDSHIEGQFNDQPQGRRISRGAVAGIAAAVVLAAGGGTAWWTWNNTTSPSDTTSTTITAPDSSSSEPDVGAIAASEQTAQIYWIETVNNRFEFTTRTLQLEEAQEPEAVLTAAFEALLSGPEASAASDLFSSIPTDTRLLDVDVRSDGVHVDLSQEYRQGGGSASMTGRLGQVIYTASTLDPDAPVWISVEGEPLEVLGGEGLVVGQPMTRSEFDQQFAL